MKHKATQIITLGLLISCTTPQSYYRAKVINVDSHTMRVRTQVSPAHYINAITNIEQLDSINKGDSVLIQKKSFVIKLK